MIFARLKKDVRSPSGAVFEAATYPWVRRASDGIFEAAVGDYLPLDAGEFEPLETPETNQKGELPHG